MRNIKSGIIAFGDLPIPVGIGSTVLSTKEPSFTMIHEKCHSPVEKRGPRVTPKDAPAKSTTGETTITWCPFCDVEAHEVVKGFEFVKGQFAAFTTEELELAASGTDTTIELTKFVKVTDLRQVMIEKVYWLIPSETQILARGYGLLYQSLAETKTAGIGSQSIWGKEHPCAVIPVRDSAAMQLLTLHVAEDLVEPDFEASIPDRAAKKRAKEIITEMLGDLEPSDLVSESRERLQAMISAKIEGKEIEFEKKEQPEPVQDIMAALNETYKKVQKRKRPPARQKAKA